MQNNDIQITNSGNDINNVTHKSWQEIPLTPMGHIVETFTITNTSRGVSKIDKLKIHPIDGSDFIVSIFKVVDGVLRGEVIKAVEEKRQLNIPVLWGIYDGQPVAVVGERNSIEIKGWASNCERNEYWEQAYALYKLLMDNNPDHSQNYARKLKKIESTLAKETQVGVFDSDKKIMEEIPENSHGGSVESGAEEKDQDRTLDAKGIITGLTSEYIIITRKEGGSFLVHRDVEMDESLRKAMSSLTVDQTLPVIWGEYDGEVVVVTSLLNVEKINELATFLTEKEKYKAACALHQIVLERYHNASMQRQAVVILNALIKKSKEIVQVEENVNVTRTEEPKSEKVLNPKYEKNQKVENASKNKTIEEKSLWQKKIFLPMGQIIKVSETQLTIKPLVGPAIVAFIHKNLIVDKNLESKLLSMSDEDKSNPNIFVAWSNYKGAVKCLWEKMTPEQLASRANSLSDDKDYEAAYSILDLLASRDSFYGKQLERVTQKLKNDVKNHVDQNIYDVPLPKVKQTDIKALLPPMGHIVKLSETTVTVTSVTGKTFVVPKTIILDNDVNKKINALNAQKCVDANIPVLWGVEGKKLLCLFGLRTPEYIHSRAITVSDQRISVALLEMLVARCDFPLYVKRLSVKKTELESQSHNNVAVLNPDHNKKEEGSYQKAVELYNKLSYDEAVPYYKLAIEEGVYRAEAVHGIINCYTKKENQQLDLAAEIIRLYILNDSDSSFIRTSKSFKTVSSWTFQHSYYDECIELNKRRLEYLERNNNNAQKDNYYATMAK